MLYCIMSASHKAICLPRRNRFSFWAFCSWRLTFFLNWEFWMIFVQSRSNSRIQHLEFWKIFPQTDREDFNTSNESTISTSLIHNTASDGTSEPLETCVLNLVFQVINDCGPRQLVELQLRYLLSMLSDHIVLRNINRSFRTRSHRLCNKHRHWNCAIILSIFTCVTSLFVLPASGTVSRFLCTSSG